MSKRASLLAVAAAAFVAQLPAQTNDLEALAARVQQLEDREEIRELLLEYGRTLDERDFVAFSELFAESGEWVNGPTSAKGRKAIFELMDNMIGHKAPFTGPRMYHLFVNERIDLDGDRATARTVGIVVVEGDDSSPRWRYLSRYHDELVRENGRWRFLRREAFTDIPASGP